MCMPIPLVCRRRCRTVSWVAGGTPGPARRRGPAVDLVRHDRAPSTGRGLWLRAREAWSQPAPTERALAVSDSSQHGTAGDVDDDAADPARLVGGEEKRGPGDVVGGTEP